MIKLSPLKAGDRIGIVAPGRKINQADVEVSERIFESWGLETEIAKNIFSAKHSYFSGTDAERLADFQFMLDNDNIKAIVCARGGYGSTRIIDQLEFSSFRKKPKWIVGFSDITAIELKLFSLGYPSIHGTMPVLFSKVESTPSVESLKKILFDDGCVIAARPHEKNREGKATGRIIGGNLSLIADSLGTSSELNTFEKILVIEEIDEYRYKIDRMLMQLKRAGKLDKLMGLVIGYMTDIKDTELSFGETIEEIVLNAVKEYNFPVAFGFPIGHENPNMAWVQGGQATLTVDAVVSQLVVSK